MIKHLLLIVLLIVLSAGCTLFQKDERLLAEHSRSDGGKVTIYYVTMGATTEDVIQVRFAKTPSFVNVITNFKENYLQSSKLLNDTTLFLILKDSVSTWQDTSIVKIPR